MQPDELRKLAKFETFLPFRLHLKDGKSYDLQQRGLFLVYNDHVVVGIPRHGESRPIAEHTVDIPLELIDRVQILAPSGAASPA